MRNVYIGLLLDCILFVLPTFVIYYGDQSTKAMCLAGISSLGSWVGFLYFGWLLYFNIFFKVIVAFCSFSILVCLFESWQV